MTNARFQNEWLSLAGEFYRVAFYILEDEAEAEDAVGLEVAGTVLRREIRLQHILHERPAHPGIEAVRLYHHSPRSPVAGAGLEGMGPRVVLRG